MNPRPYGLKTNPPRPTLDETLWRVRANETPLGPTWSDWYVDVVRNMSPTVFTDSDLNTPRISPPPECACPVHARWRTFDGARRAS